MGRGVRGRRGKFPGHPDDSLPRHPGPLGVKIKRVLEDGFAKEGKGRLHPHGSPIGKPEPPLPEEPCPGNFRGRNRSFGLRLDDHGSIRRTGERKVPDPQDAAVKGVPLLNHHQMRGVGEGVSPCGPGGFPGGKFQEGPVVETFLEHHPEHTHGERPVFSGAHGQPLVRDGEPLVAPGIHEHHPDLTPGRPPGQDGPQGGGPGLAGGKDIGPEDNEVAGALHVALHLHGPAVGEDEVPHAEPQTADVGVSDVVHRAHGLFHETVDEVLAPGLRAPGKPYELVAPGAKLRSPGV